MKGERALENVMCWLAAMVIFIIIEIVTVGLTTIWFAVGAIGAIIVAALGAGTLVQITVFLIISLGMLIFVRPFAQKYINAAHVKTNYEELIGKVVRITQDVDNVNATGCANVNGQDWTVRTENNEQKIPAGSLAKIIRISGVKLIVEKIEEETN